MHRRPHALAVGVLALVTLATAGHSVVGLDGCYSALSVEAHPRCCKRTAVDRIEDPTHGCCRATSLAEPTEAGSTSSTPSIAAAVATLLPLEIALAPVGVFAPTGSPIERPPDRRPATKTTVLLI